MHPLLSQQRAHDHIRRLQDEAHAEQQSAIAQQNISAQHDATLDRLYRFLRQINVSSRHTAVEMKVAEPQLMVVEIKPALVATFSTLHAEGIVSAFDEKFIEHFTQTLERELTHHT